MSLPLGFSPFLIQNFARADIRQLDSSYSTFVRIHAIIHASPRFPARTADQARAAAVRRDQIRYTGTPSSTMNSPGHVNCGWYSNKTTSMNNAITI